MPLMWLLFAQALAALPRAGSGEALLTLLVGDPPAGMRIEAQVGDLVVPLGDSGAGYLGAEVLLPPTRVVYVRLTSTELGRRPLYEGMEVLRGEDTLTWRIAHPDHPAAVRWPSAPSASPPVALDPGLAQTVRLALAALGTALVLVLLRGRAPPS